MVLGPRRLATPGIVISRDNLCIGRAFFLRKTCLGIWLIFGSGDDYAGSLRVNRQLHFHRSDSFNHTGENPIDYSTSNKFGTDPWQECKWNIDVPQHSKSV